MPKLTPDIRERYRVPDEWGYGIITAVQWRDVDMLAHAHHLSYLAYCEDLRSEYQEYIGFERSGHGAPSQVVSSVRANYRGSLAFRDSMLITVRTLRLGRSSTTVEYAIWKEDGQCPFTAELDLVLYDFGARRSVPIPEHVRARILALDPGADAQRDV